MTVFLVYAFPSSTVLLLIVIQVEIPEQEQDGYDAGPNFFQGMHQVRAPTYRFPSFYIVRYSILKFLDHDLNNALDASKS
jgi:hypothetical protein